MKIAVTNHFLLFSAFYILSFTVSFIIVIAFSIRRKIPLRSVLLLLTTVSLFVILGSRVFTMQFHQLSAMIRTGSVEGDVGRSAIGGLIFGIAGLILSRRLLGLDLSVIRLYGWLAPLGFGIQKIGCFLNGCCYGIPSHLPWSVQYPVCTNAHYYQWSHELIAENAAWSTPVHPVQLYESAGLFLIAFFVWQTRKKWRNSWSVMIFSLMLFCIVRFATEFFRDPSASNLAGNLSYGLRDLQWLLLLSGFTCLVLLLVSEKHFKIRHLLSASDAPSLSSSILFIIVITSVIYMFRGLFSRFEMVSLDIKVIPAILLTSVHIFRSLPEIRLRLVTASSLALPLFLMTQALPQDTVKSRHPVESFYRNEVNSYTKIDFGTAFGNYYSDLAFNPHEGLCGTVYDHEYYRHEFRMAGIGISRITKNDRTFRTYGINLSGGINNESNLTLIRDNSFFLFGVNPYFKYDRRWIGLGVGLHAGNLRWIPVTPIGKTSYDHGTRFSPVMPEAYLRAGRKDIVDIRYNYGFSFPSSFPVLTHELSIGTGLGTRESLNLRAGISIFSSMPEPHLIISGEFLLGKQFGLNLRYNFGSSSSSASPTSTVSREDYSWFSLNANYRFGFRK